MKKIIIAIMALSVAVLSTVSCDDFLTRNPKGTMDENNFFASKNAAFSSLLSCYEVMGSSGSWDVPMFILDEVSTDDAEKGGSDAGDHASAIEIAHGRALPSNKDLGLAWTNLYLGIARCNLLLRNLDNDEVKLVDANGYPLTSEVRSRYAAEARFLRAFFHYELCRHFGGVPIVDRVLTTGDSRSIVRATEEETAKFIMDELAEIADNTDLPTATELPGEELGRITRGAVWALQTKVYMFFAKDDPSYFAKARDAAKRVIDSGDYALDPDFQHLWLQDGYLSPESIFQVLQGDVSGFVFGSFIPVYCSSRGSGAYGFDQPTQNLVDEFEEGDPRLLFTILEEGAVFPKGDEDDVMDYSTYPSTGYHSRKCFITAARRGAGWGDDPMPYHIIRYADILLLYAEALIEMDEDIPTAVDCINEVRTRANNSRHADVEAKSRVTIIPNKKIPMVKSTDNLEEAVRHERRVELAMEFNRYYDLKRWNAYITTMNNFASFDYANGRGADFKAGKSELFPIPQSEIDRTDGSITQNPGY